MVTAETEAGLAVGTQLARGLGASGRAIKSLTDALRLEMMAHGTELAERLAERTSSGWRCLLGGGQVMA